MANTFKNASKTINGTPGTVLYTAPANTTAVIHAIYVSNTTLLPQTVTIQLVDASASASFRIVSDAPVPAGGTIVLDKPVNLEQNDAIRVIGSSASALEAVASVLEIN